MSISHSPSNTLKGEVEFEHEAFTNEDGTPATWIEELAPRRRLAIVVAWTLPGLMLTLWVWVNVQPGSHFSAYIFGFVPCALGALIGNGATREPLRRKYSMTTAEIPYSERAQKAAKWIAAGLLLAAFFLWSTFEMKTLREQWWAPALTLLIFGVPGLFFYFRKRRPVPTIAAARARAYYIALTQQLAAAKPASKQFGESTFGFEGWIVKVYEKTFVRALGRRGSRYLFAVIAFSIAGYLAFNQTGKDDTTWAWLAGLAGAVLAWDALLWLIGAVILIAILNAIFSGIAALPVSAAIIIGALIIASAVGDKK